MFLSALYEKMKRDQCETDYLALFVIAIEACGS